MSTRSPTAQYGYVILPQIYTSFGPQKTKFETIKHLYLTMKT
jgi:hypothetical protein